MKRINPDTNKPFEQGDLRDDCYRFWGYNLKKKTKEGYYCEYWRSWEKFEENLGYIVDWQKSNRDIMNAHSAKTRIKRLKREPKWLKDYFEDEIKAVYRAAKAAEDFTGIKYEVDHIVPLQGKLVSGLHVPWNLQLLPKKNNRKKGNRYHVC